MNAALIGYWRRSNRSAVWAFNRKTEAIFSVLAYFHQFQSVQSADAGCRFATFGLVMIVVNLLMSSFSSNMQQRVLQEGSKGNDLGDSLTASRLMFWQYSVAGVITTSWSVLSGEMVLAFEWYTQNGWWRIGLTFADSALTWDFIYCKSLCSEVCWFCRFVGLIAVYKISALFDATRASVVCSSRKQITFVLSFVVYSKPFNRLHALGLTLTLVCGFFLQKAAKAHQPDVVVVGLDRSCHSPTKSPSNRSEVGVSII